MHLVQSATGFTLTSAVSLLRSRAGSASPSHPSLAGTSHTPTRSTSAATARLACVGTSNSTKMLLLHTGTASTCRSNCLRTREQRWPCPVEEETTALKLVILWMLAVVFTSGSYQDIRSLDSFVVVNHYDALDTPMIPELHGCIDNSRTVHNCYIWYP